MPSDADHCHERADRLHAAKQLLEDLATGARDAIDEGDQMHVCFSVDEHTIDLLEAAASAAHSARLNWMSVATRIERIELDRHEAGE